jgi:hypothetical protein
LRKPNRQATARGARPTMTMAWARKAGRRFDFPCESLWATHPISEQYLTVSGTSPLNIIKLKKINLLFTRSPSSPPHTLFQTYKKKDHFCCQDRQSGTCKFSTPLPLRPMIVPEVNLKPAKHLKLQHDGSYGSPIHGGSPEAIIHQDVWRRCRKAAEEPWKTATMP